MRRSTDRPRTAPRCATCTSGARSSGGFLPSAQESCAADRPDAADELFVEFDEGSDDREVSTTMVAFVRGCCPS